MPPSITESEVLQACQTLFGEDVSICRSFLFYLQPEGARSAYRKKAKETHPDFFTREAPHIQKEQTSLFRDIVSAYDIVNLFFKEREKGLWLPPARVQSASTLRKERDHANKSDKRASGFKRPGPFPRRPVPFQPMQIGRYLYYRGFITYRMLIDAVVWQRKQRPVIGDIALRWGWLNNGAIEQIIRSGGVRGRFGEKAVDLDLLTSFQVKALLFFQSSQQERLGGYFVQRNILTPEELEGLLRELREHNARVQLELIRAGQRRYAYA